jgi:archaetidylinositol phosphate synthase
MNIPLKISWIKGYNVLTKLKEKLTFFLSIFAKFFHEIHLGPTAVSCLGLFFALLSAIAYYFGLESMPTWIAAVIFLSLSGLCDAVDGVMARLYRQATRFGGFIDSVLDRAGEILIFSGIMLGNLCSLTWCLLALTASLMVSYIRSRAEIEGVQMERVGIAERPERILILIIATVFKEIEAGMILISLLATLTIIQRVIHAHRELR